MISVLIPVFNRPSMLKRAVLSVLSQTFQDFELLVIDDGSTADLSEVEQIVRESGHRFIRQPHAGVAAARNNGIHQSSGEWLALLDSDDHWTPEKLQTQMNFHTQHSDFFLSQCEERWHRNGKRVNKKLYHAMAKGEAFAPSLARCCISASSIVLHRSVFEVCGYFDEGLAVCEDYDLWIRVTSKYKIGLIDEELVYKFGGHEDQLSRSQPAMDKFRVVALLKLLLDSGLTQDQRDLVESEIKKKVKVLLKGAHKHDTQSVPLYEEILSESEYDIQSSLLALRQTLPKSNKH